MAMVDYEAEYNNRRRVPEHPGIMARWAADSERVRSTLACDLGLPYGAGSRHRFDLFKPKDADEAPVVVYIHGGYWQRGDRADFSFVAEALVGRGAVVALPSYTLCPETTVAGIVDELRAFLVALWTRVQRRPVVVGHSAGGHLAAAMLATDWTCIPGAPPDLVRAAYAISGVFDLAPLIPTSLNEALQLTDEAARAASPILWKSPPRGTSFVAALGGAESSEFLRQSLDITAAWSEAGVKAECVVVPGANHFTVVDELARADSAMVERILHLARL
jgi:arylformamidase